MITNSSKAEATQKKDKQPNIQKKPQGNKRDEAAREIGIDEWVAERKRKALLDDSVTVRERKEYIKELEDVLRDHTPHERCCHCIDRFKFSPFFTRRYLEGR